MFETLISSRIRRTLFEHLLAHPAERFYLRGLAKALGLSISPLRRELKRLERAGILQAAQEGNILFYAVNTTSIEFLQLTQASQRTTAPSPVTAAAPSERWTGQSGSARELPLVAPSTQGEASGIGAPGASPRVPAPPSPAMRRTAGSPLPVGVISARHLGSVWRSPLRGPALVGAAGVGMALMLIVAGIFYLTMTNRQAISRVSRQLSTRRADVTVVVPIPAAPQAAPDGSSASGTMRGARWQIVPGGFGGFSGVASTQESY